MLTVDFRYIDFSETENIKPLDRQFGVYPRLSAPISLHPFLFDDLCPSHAAIAHYGSKTDVPQLRTYLVADAQAFPDWDIIKKNLRTPHRCLFTGKAEQNLGHIAPHLVELVQGDDFTRRLFTFLDGVDEGSDLHHWHRNFGIILRSRENFDTVFNHLRHFTKLQDRDGKWHFRRFWDSRHSYHWLPLLNDDLLIAARFFGRTRSHPTAVIYSISVPHAAQARMLTAQWNDDAFLRQSESALLPLSRKQRLDMDYRHLLDRATQSLSLEKVADYLSRNYPNRFGKNGHARSDAEQFARDSREIAFRMGASTELGWARIAAVAVDLGLGFLNDARFSSRGLSYIQIGYDSQGEKILAAGRECARILNVIRKRLTDETVRHKILSCSAPEHPNLNDMLNLLQEIDPDCLQAWGEPALINWLGQFFATLHPSANSGRSLAAQLAAAYCHGNGFRSDPSLAYREAVAATPPEDYDQAIISVFASEFRKS